MIAAESETNVKVTTLELMEKCRDMGLIINEE